MNKLVILALCISSILLAIQVNAANQVVDARGNAMGNTGVASADYLVAPFYNPALGASFHGNDGFIFLLPAAGFSVRDQDDSLTTIDDLQSSIEDFEDSSIPLQEQVDNLNGYLDQLTDNQPLIVTAGLGLAAALPTETVSINLFAYGYTEIVAAADIAANKGNAPAAVEQRYQNSYVDMLAFGYAEIGLSFAKELYIAEETVSFGVTPKYQRMRTYAQRVAVADFDIDDYDQSEITENTFNFDLGVVWYTDNFRTGLAVKDLLAQEIKAESNGVSDIYQLNTQVTLGLAYVFDNFTAAVDADLTKQTRFKNLNDDTQFFRVGIEGGTRRWAQLRAGYEVDLENTLANSITAGIGLNPFDLVSLDIAASYAGDNQFGVSGNLAFTF